MVARYGPLGTYTRISDSVDLGTALGERAGREPLRWRSDGDSCGWRPVWGPMRPVSRGCREGDHRSGPDPALGIWDERRPGSYNPAVGERCLREQPALHYLYSAIQELNPPRSIRHRLDIGAGDLTGYTTPTVYVTGEEDVMHPSPIIEAAAEATPGARLERVPTAGHSVYFERPGVFNALLSGFLRDVYPS